MHLLSAISVLFLEIRVNRPTFDTKSGNNAFVIYSRSAFQIGIAANYGTVPSAHPLAKTSQP